MSDAVTPEVAEQDAKPQNGKLYRWDGKEFQEMVFEKNSDRRVPMTEEAFAAALKVRVAVQKKIRMRPDISIVASAMVQHAAQQAGIVEAVAAYGLEMYAKNAGLTAAAAE